VALDIHAKRTQHLPYTCRCLKKFSRADCLDRHLYTLAPAVKFPCSYCSRYDGTSGFSRLDHLTQHLRSFHRILDSPSPLAARKQHARMRKRYTCPHADCAFDSQADVENPSKTFETKNELSNHLRFYHNESPFPCRQDGCSKNGGQGFFREKDLLNHERLHH